MINLEKEGHLSPDNCQIFCHSVGQTLFRFMAYAYNKAAKIPKHKTDGAPATKKIIFIGIYTQL